MNPRDFDYLACLIREQSGIVLTPDKLYLVESRLMPVMREMNCNDLGAVVNKLRGGDSKLSQQVVDAMTTNETLFFRDTKPFETLKSEVFPALLAARSAGQKIRIWSAACSTGQEPYSIALLLEEERARFNPDRFEILATDLSPSVLKKASAGVYSQFEIQRGLPVQMLIKHFQKDGDRWILHENMRKRVTFRPFNLLQDPAVLGPCDVILCRNVLIYFDNETKTRILDRMARILRPDGVLILGGSESTLGISERFAPMAGQRSVYVLKA
jgi:chemotaxis protein methyltransferase CheR